MSNKRDLRFRKSTLGLALLLCAAGAQAQLYKWVDAKGVTHFSDQAPPANARLAPVKPLASGPSAVPLPFELAQAARNHPVVLFTSKTCGNACDLARSFLQKRGVPFTEKTVNTGEDLAKLKEAGSAGQLPLLLIGRNKSLGFQSDAWAGLLDTASYPATSILPSNYRYPAPVAAAPVVEPAKPAIDPQVAAAAEEAARRKRATTPPPNPAGIQF